MLKKLKFFVWFVCFVFIFLSFVIFLSLKFDFVKVVLSN